RSTPGGARRWGRRRADEKYSGDPRLSAFAASSTFDRQTFARRGPSLRPPFLTTPPRFALPNPPPRRCERRLPSLPSGAPALTSPRALSSARKPDLQDFG